MCTKLGLLAVQLNGPAFLHYTQKAADSVYSTLTDSLHFPDNVCCTSLPQDAHFYQYKIISI